MALLVIDTALDSCSVAVIGAAGEAISHETEVIGRGHAECLMAMIERVMGRSGLGFTELDRIGVTIGPGSFTGIRVGLATARGLGLAAGLAVVGVSTLDAIALEAAGLVPKGPVLVVLDARRSEVYAGLYAADGNVLAPPSVLTVDEAVALAVSHGASLFGSGASILKAQAAASDLPVLGTSSYADILHVGNLARRATVTGVPPKPLYLRAPDAKPQTRGRVALQQDGVLTGSTS